MKIIETKQKTKVIKKTLNPKWEENFEFPLNTKTITLEVWDQDALSDDFMGTATVTFDQPAFDGWIDLKQKKAKDKVSGKIHIRYERKTT